MNKLIPDLQICRFSPVQPSIGKPGRLYNLMVVHHAWDSSDVTLAFEAAQVIPPFSKEETDATDEIVLNRIE
jgi:hypothetical protein